MNLIFKNDTSLLIYTTNVKILIHRVANNGA